MTTPCVALQTRAGSIGRSVLKGIAPYALPLLAMLLAVDHAVAGTTASTTTSAYGTNGLDASQSTEFDQAGKKGDAWIRNSYGKTVAIFSSVVGLAVAGFTKSMVPAGWGVGVAAIAAIVPPGIGGFFPATL